MKYSSFIILLLLSILNACHQKDRKLSKEHSNETEYETITNPNYQLEKPQGEISTVLMLFGGYPEVADDIRREFNILPKAQANRIALIYSNYNRKLWFEDGELTSLASQIDSIFSDNKLPRDRVYFGGFSSGGNIAFLLGNYLASHPEIRLSADGVFLVDSPIDLAELYFSSEKNLERKFSEISVQESSWLIKELGDRFGDPNEDLGEYEEHSIFTLKSRNTKNLKHLKETKIRLYTEPDTLWWKENRMVDYKQTNAFLIKELFQVLSDEGYSAVEYIPTQNKGFRANGDRHPHSWSIVDTDHLMNWILETDK